MRVAAKRLAFGEEQTSAIALPFDRRVTGLHSRQHRATFAHTVLERLLPFSQVPW